MTGLEAFNYRAGTGIHYHMQIARAELVCADTRWTTRGSSCAREGNVPYQDSDVFRCPERRPSLTQYAIGKARESRDRFNCGLGVWTHPIFLYNADCVVGRDRSLTACRWHGQRCAETWERKDSTFGWGGGDGYRPSLQGVPESTRARVLTVRRGGGVHNDGDHRRRQQNGSGHDPACYQRPSRMVHSAPPRESAELALRVA